VLRSVLDSSCATTVVMHRAQATLGVLMAHGIGLDALSGRLCDSALTLARTAPNPSPNSAQTLALILS